MHASWHTTLLFTIILVRPNSATRCWLFGALKSNWKKAMDNFQVTHLGLSIANRTFAQVFKTAWTNSVKMSTIVNSFAKAGMYPVNRNAVGK